MKVNQLADFFEKMIASYSLLLDQAPKKEYQESFNRLIDLFQRYGDQSIKGFVKLVDQSCARELLLQRCKAYKAADDDLSEILTEAETLSALDLYVLTKRLLKTGVKASAKKVEYIDQLRAWLINGKEQEPHEQLDTPQEGGKQPQEESMTNEIETADLTQQIEEAYQLYMSLEQNLETLEYKELRERFEPLKQKSAEVLRGVLEKLDMSTSGPKWELTRNLLNALEFQKNSIDQTSRI